MKVKSEEKEEAKKSEKLWAIQSRVPLGIISFSMVRISMDKPDMDAYIERIVLMEGNSFKREAISDFEMQAKNDGGEYV